MQIQRSYKFRFYPNAEQRQQLAVEFGHSRFVWNASLDARGIAYRCLGRSESYVSLSAAVTELKADPDYAWLKEATAGVLVQALKDQDTAFKNFFEGRASYPKFKKKGHAQSIRYQLDQRQIARTFNAALGLLKLPKLGAVKLRWSRQVVGIPKMVTVSRDSVGDYFVSFACEETIKPLPKAKAAVGIDVGIKDVVVTSDGFQSGAPKYIRKYERQLKRAQQTLSRRVKGSGRWHRARVKVAKLQRKIARCRADFSHKLTTWLVRTYDLLAVEDLHVKGMVRNRKLSKALADSSLGELLRQIEYKADWYGRQLLTCGRFDPSSKACSDCGAVNAELTLSDRQWICQGCGAAHDRDVNAAKNILAFATAGGRSVAAHGAVQTAVKPA